MTECVKITIFDSGVLHDLLVILIKHSWFNCFIYSKFVIKYSSKDLENIQICLMKMKALEMQLLNVFTEKLLTELNDEKDS